MNKYEGITTISSEEYRELIEEKCEFRNRYQQAMKDMVDFEDEVGELRAALKAAQEEATQSSYMCDFYRGEIAGLKEQLRAYESGEEVANG